jgi:hypothetical protein
MQNHQAARGCKFTVGGDSNILYIKSSCCWQYLFRFKMYLLSRLVTAKRMGFHALLKTIKYGFFFGNNSALSETGLYEFSRLLSTDAKAK